jgi:hypothetical protein
VEGTQHTPGREGGPTADHTYLTIDALGQGALGGSMITVAKHQLRRASASTEKWQRSWRSCPCWTAGCHARCSSPISMSSMATAPTSHTGAGEDNGMGLIIIGTD